MLAPQGLGQALAELLVEGGDQGRFLGPDVGVDVQQDLQIGVRQAQTRQVQRVLGRHATDRGVHGLSLAVQTLDDPLQHAGVVAKARPDELAVLVLAEPVDEEETRQLRRVGLLAQLQPVAEIVAHVVAAEGQHGEGIAAQLADLVLGGGGAFRGHGRAHEDAVLPVEGFRHQRHSRGAAAAEQDGVDWHTRRVFPLGRDGRALAGGRGEAGVRVSGGLARRRIMRLTLPVGQARRRFLGQAFPPDVAVSGQGDVGEDGVLRQGLERVQIGVAAGAGRHAEEARLRVYGVQTTVLAETHPGDVVADRLGLPAVQRRLQHGQVGLAAGAREGGGHILGHALGAGQLEDQHVLGQPPLVAGHDRGDAQGVALLAQQGVAAVARAVGPDFARFREVDDPLVVIAGPRHIGLTFSQGRAQGVNGGHEDAVGAQHVQRRLAHAGHDAHRHGDIAAVGDLDAQGGDLGAQRAHAEGHHIHGAALHAAVEQAVQTRAHLDGVRPVVGRAGVGLVFRADEGAALDAGHVLGVRGGVVAAGALGLVQFLQRALGDQVGDDGRFLGLRAVAPMHPVRLGQGRDLRDPGDQTLVVGRRGIESGNRYVCSHNMVS
ncbi:hypothetical protein D3C85_784680 [compost metagenome]